VQVQAQAQEQARQDVRATLGRFSSFANSNSPFSISAPFSPPTTAKKTNLNSKLEECNIEDERAAYVFPAYEDVGGLKFSPYESMMAEEFPAEGYSSALPIFHDGTSGMHALETQVDALDVALQAAKANLVKARMIQEEKMTNTLWHYMNEHKKILFLHLK
jgi:hypothetical protein